MSMNISIRISGDKETLQKIRKLGQSLYIFDSAMRDIGKELTHYFSNDVFNTNGKVLGKRWAELKPATVKAKSKRQILSGQMILIGSNTPHMKDSFIYDADRNSVVITNSADYFAYHQSNEPRKGTSARTIKNAHIANMDIGWQAQQGHSSITQKGKNVILGGSGLPRRVMMKVTPGVRGMVRDIIDADVRTKLRKAGL